MEVAYLRQDKAWCEIYKSTKTQQKHKLRAGEKKKKLWKAALRSVVLSKIVLITRTSKAAEYSPGKVTGDGWKTELVTKYLAR